MGIGEIGAILIGFFLGGICIWFLQQFRLAKKFQDDSEQLKATIQKLETDKTVVQNQAESLTNDLGNTKKELEAGRIESTELNVQLSAAKSDYSHLKSRLEEQKGEVDALQEKFTREFENLANKILDEKSQKFTSQNKENIKELLNPLGEKIKAFEKKVEETYVNTSKDQSALKTQIEHLSSLNKQMLSDANNLTKALKGDSKAQGNWGEIVLSRVLEKSGLEKDREYTIQESVRDEEGRLKQPDVVIHLPENRKLIVDSKVSLTAYERYVKEEDERMKEQYLKEHTLSLKNHLKGLSEKNYHDLYGIRSPDFVLMFIPIEPAFGLAIQQDDSLYLQALELNIVMVSASTLLATLRTVDSIWRQEKQSKYALRIAEESGKLYDKFAGFVNDLVEVGKRMDSSKKAYEGAMNKLTYGTGNLVNRVQKLKQLGAKANKSLPDKILERAETEQLEIEG